MHLDKIRFAAIGSANSLNLPVVDYIPPPEGFSGGLNKI